MRNVELWFRIRNWGSRRNGEGMERFFLTCEPIFRYSFFKVGLVPCGFNTFTVKDSILGQESDKTLIRTRTKCTHQIRNTKELWWSLLCGCCRPLRATSSSYPISPPLSHSWSSVLQGGLYITLQLRDQYIRIQNRCVSALDPVGYRTLFRPLHHQFCFLKLLI